MKRKLNYKKILIATGVLVVVATKSTKSEAKKELSSIITKLEVDGNKFNTKETVLNEIIRLNEEITSEHVEIKNFITASEIKNGSAELHAKADSNKYTGKVNIIITKVDTEEERLEKIIKKIKVANDKERYGKEYVEAYKEYFAFLEKTMEAKFKIDPWVIYKEPTEENKTSIFLQLQDYMREIRISHYKLGLVEQQIIINFKKEKMLIDTENKTLKFENLDVWLSKGVGGIPNTAYYISATIKYQVK